MKNVCTHEICNKKYFECLEAKRTFPPVLNNFNDLTPHSIHFSFQFPFTLMRGSF